MYTVSLHPDVDKTVSKCSHTHRRNAHVYMTSTLAQDCEQVFVSVAAHTMVQVRCYNTPLGPQRFDSVESVAVEPQQTEACIVPLGPPVSLASRAARRTQPLLLQRFQYESSSACVARAFQCWATAFNQPPCGVPLIFCPKALRWRDTPTGRFVRTPKEADLTPEEKDFVRKCKAATSRERNQMMSAQQSTGPSASRAKQVAPQPKPEV